MDSWAFPMFYLKETAKPLDNLLGQEHDIIHTRLPIGTHNFHIQMSVKNWWKKKFDNKTF